MCPIFQVSNVSGENMELLKMFLNLLSTRVKCNLGEPAEFQIDDTFSVPGVGTVVSGTLLQVRKCSFIVSFYMYIHVYTLSTTKN